MSKEQMITGRRRKRQRNFVTIENSMFEDERLSWKAKGLLGYLLTKSDGWKVKMGDLVKRSTDGEVSIKSALRELRKYGYLTSYRTRNSKGHFHGIVWEYDDIPMFEVDEVFEVDETPEPLEPQEVCPQGGKPTAWITHRVENPPCISNKDFNNKDFNNVEEEEEIILPVITEDHVINTMHQLINEREITNQKTITAILKVASKCKVIGKTDWDALDNYVITVVEEKMRKFGQRQKVKQQAAKRNIGGGGKQPVRTENMAESILQQQEEERRKQEQQNTQPTAEQIDLEEERRRLEEELKVYKKD